MTKNVFDLITAIVTGLEVIADGVCVYLGAIGKVDKAVASAIAGSITIAGGAVLGICARFIPEGEANKLAKK